MRRATRVHYFYAKLRVAPYLVAVSIHIPPATTGQIRDFILQFRNGCSFINPIALAMSAFERQPKRVPQPIGFQCFCISPAEGLGLSMQIILLVKGGHMRTWHAWTTSNYC